MSLMVAGAVVIMQMIIGCSVGLVAGYAGKKTDMILMRITDTVNALPDMIIVLILSAMMAAIGISGREKMLLLIVFLSIFSWTGMAKVVRAQTLYIRELEYVKVAELCGVPPARRLYKYILPGVMDQVIAVIPVSISGVILTEATISFLGFGLPYPYASWGNMLSSAMDLTVLGNHWNAWLPPGIMIIITIVILNILGEQLKNQRRQRGK